jgi:excisionase family DNA binding protein
MNASHALPRHHSASPLPTTTASSPPGADRRVADGPDDPINATTARPSLLLTLNEVAAELRCARRSVERHIAAHELTTVRFGRCVRVERTELARFIAGHTERSDDLAGAADATSA